MFRKNVASIFEVKRVSQIWNQQKQACHRGWISFLCQCLDWLWGPPSLIKWVLGASTLKKRSQEHDTDHNDTSIMLNTEKDQNYNSTRRRLTVGCSASPLVFTSWMCYSALDVWYRALNNALCHYLLSRRSSSSSCEVLVWFKGITFTQ